MDKPVALTPEQMPVLAAVTELVSQAHTFSSRVVRSGQQQAPPKLMFVILIGGDVYVYLDRRSRIIDLSTIADAANDLALSESTVGEYTPELRNDAVTICLDQPEAHPGKGRKRQICGDTVLRYELEALQEKRTKYGSEEDDDDSDDDDDESQQPGAEPNNAADAASSSSSVAESSSSSSAHVSPLDKMVERFHTVMVRWAKPEGDQAVAAAVKRAVQRMHCL